MNFLNLCRGLLPKPMESFFIQLFGEDFLRLCDEEAVSPDSESLRVLENTQVCDSSKVENDAVGEKAATHTASEAEICCTSRGGASLQHMRPRVPRASSTLSVHGWTELTEPATPARPLRCSTTREKGACALVPAPQNHHSLVKGTTAKKNQFYASRSTLDATCIKEFVHLCLLRRTIIAW